MLYLTAAWAIIKPIWTAIKPYWSQILSFMAGYRKAKTNDTLASVQVANDVGKAMESAAATAPKSIKDLQDSILEEGKF